MSNLAPSGPIADAMAGLVALVCNVPFFQTWVGAGTAADAAANVFSTESGYPIAAVGVAAGVLTVTTRDTHALSIGQKVTLSGASLGAESGVNIAGVYTVAAVTPNTFTAPIDAPDGPPQVFADFAFVTPCARPIAVVMIPQEGALDSSRVGAGGGMVSSGKLELLVEADISSQYVNDPLNAPMEANNAAGELLKGLWATNDTGLALFTDGDGNALEFIANGITLTGSPLFRSKDDQDDNTIRFERWCALYEVTWGLQG